MEWVVAFILIAFSFAAGWFSSAIVDSWNVYRRSREIEAWIADQNKQFFLEERRDRE
jgi:hypothetical protein